MFNENINENLKYSTKWKYPAGTETGIEEILSKILSEYSKKFNFKKFINSQEIAKITQNFNKKFSAYSPETREIYFLLSYINDKKQEEYVLMTYSIENKFKSKKLLKFEIENFSQKKPLYFDIEEMIIHQNQLCLKGREYLAFIPNLTKATENEKELNLVITVLHTTVIENDKKRENYFKKVKFHHFPNYFGVLDNLNTFKLYNIETRISKVIIRDIKKDFEIVDFAFGPMLEFSWLNFCVFLIDSRGGLSYFCPLIPEDLTINLLYINNMTNFMKNSSSNVSFSNKDVDNLNENVINNIHLLYNKNVNKSKVDTQDYVTFKINDYLKSVHKRIKACSIKIFDKRLERSILPIKDALEENSRYKEIHVLNIFPLVILRISEVGLIDVVMCFEDLKPTRDDSLHLNFYLIETIYIKNVIKNMKVFQDAAQLNILRSEKSTSLIVNYLNDIYRVDLDYVKSLSELYNQNSEEDLRCDFHSKVSKLLTFKYDSVLAKSNTFGYYGIEFVADRFILATLTATNKFLVRDFKPEENELDIRSEVISANKETLNRIRNKIHNVNFRSDYSSTSITELDNLYNETVDVLKRSEENESALKKEIEEQSIYNKLITINKSVLDKISLTNMEEFFSNQIEGLFRHYQAIYGKYSSYMKYKAKYINETIKKFDLKKFSDFKKELEENNIKIEKKIKETTEKKKLIEEGIKKMKDSLVKLDGKMENLMEYSTLKAYFSKQFEEVKIIQNDVKDIKQEVYKIKKDDKEFKVLKEPIDPKMIDKEQFYKLELFNERIIELKEEIKEAYRTTEKCSKKY